jgi:hypothetical protein
VNIYNESSESKNALEKSMKKCSSIAGIKLPEAKNKHPNNAPIIEVFTIPCNP